MDSMKPVREPAPKLPVATLGALLALTAVAAGAFGAHALRGRLDATHLQIFETAARYHLIHAVALVAIGLAGGERAASLKPGAWMIAAGIVLFSGSLYALALGCPTWTGAITPLGGLSFMAGWLALAIALLRRPA
jgi:uncharacterized membrane protein YgdD (TMEM256/DUF423 family)